MRYGGWLRATAIGALLAAHCETAWASNPYYRPSWLHHPDFSNPDLVVNAFQTSLHCFSGGTQTDQTSFFYCYEGGQHTRTVQFAGSAMYIHTPDSMVSCNVQADSQVSEVLDGRAWTRTSGTCWQMICQPGSCGNAPVNFDDAWSVSILHRTGAAPFVPSGTPDIYFTGFGASPIQLHRCYFTDDGQSGQSIAACFDDSNNRTHDLISQGAYLQIHDRQQDRIVINCDENPSSAERQVDGTGITWNKRVADCFWTGTDQSFQGIVGRR